jgi:hypothetical protein
MSPMGWEALGQWCEDAARIEPLAGGFANDVRSVRIQGHLAVGRLGARSDADLGGELAAPTARPCRCRSRRQTTGCSRMVWW